MKKILLLICIFLLSYRICDPPRLYTEDISKSQALILDSAERFFKSLKERKFKITWDLLTKKSRERIIDDVYKTSKQLGEPINKEDIIKDFNNGGEMFNSYWNAFLTTFDPDMVLEDSRWEMGFVKKDKAEIILTYKKAKRPARLKMFKEDGSWKVGLVETFWTRKY